MQKEYYEHSQNIMIFIFLIIMMIIIIELARC